MKILIRGIIYRHQSDNEREAANLLASSRDMINEMADWSSDLRSRLRNQKSRVQIPAASRGLCDKQLHVLTCLKTYLCTISVCLSII
jgi:hypothetical protein